MTDAEHYELASSLLSVVLAAGQVEMAYFGNNPTVASKSDSSPVTAADQEAEDIITRRLTELCPDIPIVGEEAAAAGAAPAAGDQFFLVDPLDGTKDFIAGGDDFTVNIALVEDGQPVFGVVYQPPTGQLFMTIAADRAIEAKVAPDCGATSLNDIETSPIRTRLSESKDAGDLTVALSRSHPSEVLEQQLNAQGLQRRVRVGSSLKFCLVARGDADIYPRLTSISEWDTAAGHAVTSAAGGAVLNLHGQPLRYGGGNKFRIQPFVAWADPALADHFHFQAE